MIRHRMVLIILAVTLILTALLTVSCAEEAAPTEEPAPTEAAAPTEAPTEAPAPTEAAAPTEEPELEAAPTEEPAPTATSAQVAAPQGGVDLDAIFPAGRGKDLSLMGCTGCHSFVPLVIVGFNEEEWDRNARSHRDFVASMSDDDFEILYAYLKENFGPDTPIPELPEELLEQWTSY